MNQVVLIGNLKSMEKVDDLVLMNLTYSRPLDYGHENEQPIVDIIPIITSIKNDYLNNLKQGDLVGVKGKVEIYNDKLVIRGEKLTFLSSNNEVN